VNFTAKEIVTIIRAIEGTSISSFEFDGLKIQCGERKPAPVVETPLFAERDLYKPEPREEPDRPIDTDDQIQDEIENDPQLMDLQRQTLMIEDPAAFEAMMDREDIEDATNSKRTEQSLSEG